MATGDLSNFPGPDEVQSTNKHLWYLLTGDSLLANDDVVHEELTRNCNKIVSALTFYPRRPPVMANTTNAVSGIETANENEKSDGTLGEGIAKSGCKKRPSEANRDAEKRLKARLAKKLDLEESIAWEIFCSYMMFEYKGKATTYSKIMETELHVVAFLDDIWSFYMRERLCLIYCSQIILAEATNDKNQYCEIFSAFVQGSSLDSWVMWLCASFDEAVDETEKIALLHTLAILMYNYSVQDRVMEAFLEHYKPLPRAFKSQEVLQAEAVLTFCFLQSGDSTDQVHNAYIEQFVDANIRSLLENPFSIAGVLSSLMLRFPENEGLRAKVKEIQDPEKCVPSLIHLVHCYKKESFNNRHGLTSMTYRCVYNSIDIILRLLVKENFGTSVDWYILLSRLLRDSDIAAEFLEGNSTDIVSLYLEALVQFPVESSPILSIWGSICEAVSESNTCTAVLAQLTEIKYIAEIFDKVDPCDMRYHSDNDRLLLERRVVAGVPVKIGTVGTLIDDTSPVIICWILESPCTSTTVWDIIYHENITPVIKMIQEGGSPLDMQSEADYCFLPTRQKILICEIAEFLSTFGRASRALPPRLFELYRPICFILSVLIKESKHPNVKADFAGLLLRLVDAGSKFNELLFQEFLIGIWPRQLEQNVAADLVIGYESVMNSNYSLSMGLLTATLGIVKETDARKTPISAPMQAFFTQSVLFIVENIFQSFCWAIASESAKHEIMSLSLKILYSLFQLKDDKWNKLKEHCVNAVIARNSVLLAVLGQSEELLQDSIIKPNFDNKQLPEIVHYSLSLLLQMMTFDTTVIKRLDTVLNMTLPQKIARFARHRLSTKIPTLAINLLGKIAQEIYLSLLSSFGSESESFRDILIQRLEFKSEDIHLKIAILEFLNICVHMQNGLIEHFLLDESLVERLLELITEEDESIQIAALAFVRALFHKDAGVIKRVKQIWALISEPLKKMTRKTNLKIASMTFDIYSFEVYNNGLVDANFQRELNEIFQRDNMQKIITILVEQDETEIAVKCLAAFKHLMVIIFSKPEVSSMIPRETKSLLLEQVYEKFWSLNQEKDNHQTSEKRLVFLADLLFHLCPNEESDFLEDFSNRMALSFFECVFPVKTSLMTVANLCIKNCRDEINVRIVDSLVKVIAGVFFSSERLFSASEPEKVFPLLLITASTASSLICSDRCVQVDRVYQKHHLATSIAHTAYWGISSGTGVQVVSECLSALIKMTMREESSLQVYHCDLIKYLWLPISKYTVSEDEESEEKAKSWYKVFALCVHLSTRLLTTQKFYYMENCLNFWAILGQYFTSRLWGLSEITNRALINNPERNFNDLQDILMFDVFILNFVSSITPYFDTWKKIQALELSRIIEGVYVTLRTAISFLTFPSPLIPLISKQKSQHLGDYKLTPQLLEIQTKLWDVMDLGVHIFCRLKYHSFGYIEPAQLHSTIHSVGQHCIRALTKGDKRSYPSINVTQRIVTTLEKTLTILYFINQKVREVEADEIRKGKGPTKSQLAAARDMSSEVSMMCDNIRRLSTQKSDFLIKMCSKLESPYK